MKRQRVGVVGIGKIARDQHIPVIQANSAFEFAACASRNSRVEGVPNYTSIEDMLSAEPNLDAIAICTPPQFHYEAARLALARGKHVFLEKPPCASVVQLNLLAGHAQKAGVTLFQAWHSQHGPAVEPARRWLESRKILAVSVTWKEDVRQWHPGQTWIWQAGGFGVFDPGINAISILTQILPELFFVASAKLFVPSNCEAPIAADLTFATDAGLRISAEFDFRHTGVQTWDIDIETDEGVMQLSSGGAYLTVDGKPAAGKSDIAPGRAEYTSLYKRFAELIGKRQSDVDGRPFQLVADAFMIGKTFTTEPFEF